jgi:hypothetical protein
MDALSAYEREMLAYGFSVVWRAAPLGIAVAVDFVGPLRSVCVLRGDPAIYSGSHGHSGNYHSRAKNRKLLHRGGESEKRLNLSIRHNPGLVNDATIAVLMREWSRLMDQAVANPASMIW